MVYLHVMNLEWVKFDTGNNAHQITISNVFSKKKKERKKKKKASNDDFFSSKNLLSFYFFIFIFYLRKEFAKLVQ